MEAELRATVIPALAGFLRKNSEKILNGECKFTLSTSALTIINSTFPDVIIHESSAGGPHNLTPELFQDVKFIYDFIGKTTSVKLFHDMKTLRGGVDLTQFKNLTVLELKKLPVHLVMGLSIKDLNTLTCKRSIGSLKELLGSLVDDKCSDHECLKLKELNVSCNALEGLDESLEIVPDLETLDLSCNHLKHLDEIRVLDKLTVLKLNFNMLNYIPILSLSSSRLLRVLSMRNNNLEDLRGLENLISLQELDVSANCLAESNALTPLRSLPLLKILSLTGNPLFHSEEYKKTASFFHPEVVANGIILDGKNLSHNRILILRSRYGSRKKHSESCCGHQTSINVLVEDIENTITRSDHQYRSLRGSTVTKTQQVLAPCPSVDKNICAPSSLNENVEEGFLRSKNNKERRKIKKKIREAVINQPLETEGENKIPGDKTEGLTDDRLPSHILTKKLIEARRKEYGSEWLLPSQSFKTLSVDEPPQRVPTNSPVSATKNAFTESHYQINRPIDLSVEPGLSETSESHSGPDAIVETCNEPCSTDYGHEANSCVLKHSIRKCSSISDDIQVLDSSSSDIVPTSVTSDSNTTLSKLFWHHIQSTDMQSSDSEKDSDDVVFTDSEEEVEDRIFLLERKEKQKLYPLFVSIGKKYLKEKHFESGKLSDFLDLTCLFSIKLKEFKVGDIMKYEVSLAFDTLKASKQKRHYILDDDKAAKHLASILQPFADAKTFEDSALGALECMKCRSQFSKQVAHLKVLQKKISHFGEDVIPSSNDSSKDPIEETDVCPNCGSSMIVEMDTIPLPSMMLPVSKKSVTKMQKSDLGKDAAASSSLGNISSMLYSMMKYPKTKKGPVTSTPKGNFVTDGNETNNEDSLDVTVIENKNLVQADDTVSGNDTTGFPKMRQNSSDIAIHRNPSQSSIAVISSDSECDTELDAIPESDSLCSPAPISPPLQQDFSETDYFTARNIIPEDSSASSSSGQLSEKEFQECAVPETENSSTPSDEGFNLINLLSQKEEWGYERFSSIDHRLKLFLEFTIFGKDEELDACLEAAIVYISTGIEFKGLFVFSSKKMYVMKILEEISDDVAKCVQKVNSWPLNQLKAIKLLPGSQGFCATFGSEKMILFLTEDADCCNSFISFITDIIRKRLQGAHFPKFETSVIEDMDLIKKEVFFPRAYALTHLNLNVEILLYSLVHWCSGPSGVVELERVAIVVMSTYLFIAKVSFEKTTQKKELQNVLLHHEPMDCQPVSDIIGITIQENLCQAEFNFLNENNKASSWLILAKSRASLFALINSIQAPWESMFEINLPLCLAKGHEVANHSDC